jgi:hypothetical protein
LDDLRILLDGLPKNKQKELKIVFHLDTNEPSSSRSSDSNRCLNILNEIFLLVAGNSVDFIHGRHKARFLRKQYRLVASRNFSKRNVIYYFANVHMTSKVKLK